MNAKAETRHKAQQAIGRDAGIVLLRVAIQCGLAHCAIKLTACKPSVQSTSNGHPEDFKNEMDETKHNHGSTVPQTQPVVENI